MFARTWELMRTLGLEEDLKAIDGIQDMESKMAYYKSDQTPPILCGHAEHTMRSFHRAEFLKVLEDHVPSHYRKHFNKRLTSYEDSAQQPVLLHFKDGTTAQCDVLIGADGIKSAVRRSMFAQLTEKKGVAPQTYRWCMDATWSGLVAYRGLVPTDTLKAQCPNHMGLTSPVYYFGKDKSAISYPISQGHMLNVAVMVYQPGTRGLPYEGPWVTAVDRAEFLDEIASWDSEVCSLFKDIHSPSKWAVNEVVGLPTFVSDRAAIMGDAAHAMMPLLASGASQAVEDAIILATVLAHSATQADTIPHGLEIYDEIRRPFALHIQELSYLTGESIWLESMGLRHYTAEDSAAGRIPHAELVELVTKDQPDKFRWAWTTSLKGDQDRAVEMLNSAV
ncbi:FAD/NAD(P)-binding domain-containing protein [Trametopsis cervina]|nr:FAD/NAD(P)-binding domain-containing protein [Trametopsis cervina]